MIRLLLTHLEVMKYKKRVKAYVNHLIELDQLLNRKLEDVDKVLLLTEGILKGQHTFDFDSLTQQRVNERAELIRIIQKDLDIVDEPIRKKKSRKSKKEDGKSTYDITREMFSKGMTIEQIAAERELVISTIEGHLGKAVESGTLDITVLVNEDELKEIMEAIQLLPSGFTSKELYDALQGKYGYGKLRAVMSHLKNKSEREIS